MGMMTAAIIGLGAAQVGAGIGSGISQKNEANYNASIFQNQAGMIDEQKKLQAMQEDRAIRKAMGTTVAATASKGIKLEGSPVAIMIDTMTQMEYDKAIGQYNLDMQKYGVMAEAESIKRKGNLAMMYGVTSGVMSGAQTFASLASPMPKKSLTTSTTTAKKGISV